MNTFEQQRLRIKNKVWYIFCYIYALYSAALWTLNLKNTHMKNVTLVLISCFFSFQSSFAVINNTAATEKTITIYWDASLSMNNKDLDKELVFLDAYFKSIKDAKVRLISFSNSIDVNKEYAIVAADWSLLKQQLLETKYEGIALYSLLKPTFDSDINLLFTDGNGVFDKLSLKDHKSTYIISTQPNSNNIRLGAESREAKGDHVNLNQLDIEKGLAVLGVKIAYKLNYKNKKRANKELKVTGVVTGNVYGFEGVLEGVAIRVKDAKNGVVSNVTGGFSIKAKKGDILLVSFLGKKTATISVDSTDDLSVFLYEDENMLKEVALRTAKKKEELINTGHGKIAKKKVGYAVKTLDSDRINSGVASTLSDAAGGKLGATQNGIQSLDRTIFRGGNTILGNKFPLIVIDGMPIRRSESNGAYGKTTDFIDPNNVANMTILKGMAATNRYGSEGVNGVILITTKTSLGGVAKQKKKHNSALAKNNDYKEEVSLMSNSANLKHYAVFKACKNLEEEYVLYLTKRDDNANNAQFFIEVSDYVAQWGAKKLAQRIFLNSIETNAINVPVLKYIAYKATENNNHLDALKIYQKILQLKPKEAQSYRDVALAYQKAGQYQKALDVYNGIFNNTYSNVPSFSGVYKSINSEMKQLILKNRKQLNLAGTPSRFLQLKSGSIQARIVFEWNSNDAEFELQFVNPQKKFFKWNHTKSENASRMFKEKEQGFYMEEFLLDGIGTGEWIINIENKTKNMRKPLSVRYTVYKNYGGSNEKIASKILILNTLKKKAMISKIDF